MYTYSMRNENKYYDNDAYHKKFTQFKIRLVKRIFKTMMKIKLILFTFYSFSSFFFFFHPTIILWRVVQHNYVVKLCLVYKLCSCELIFFSHYFVSGKFCLIGSWVYWINSECERRKYFFCWWFLNFIRLSQLSCDYNYYFNASYMACANSEWILLVNGVKIVYRKYEHVLFLIASKLCSFYEHLTRVAGYENLLENFKISALRYTRTWRGFRVCDWHWVIEWTGNIYTPQGASENSLGQLLPLCGMWKCWNVSSVLRCLWIIQGVRVKFTGI